MKIIKIAFVTFQNAMKSLQNEIINMQKDAVVVLKMYETLQIPNIKP